MLTHAAEVNVDDVIERVAPRRKRVRLFGNPVAGDGVAPHHAPQTVQMSAPPAANEVLFTLEQVKAIVQRALDEKDAAMREEFDVIIRQQLAEQFEIFTKVNEDYISRQMRDSTFDCAFAVAAPVPHVNSRLVRLADMS